MPAPGRQIEGILPETPVEKLAYEAIVQRLAAVTSQFPLAAEGVIDEHEPVHQLRVATRRAVEALELFRDFLPPRRTKRLIKKLKSIRRAAGNARDLDVFISRLTGTSEDSYSKLMQTLSLKRKAAQEQIVELFELLVPSKSLAIRIEDVTERVRPRTKKTKKWSRRPLATWAPRRFSKEAESFLDAVPEKLNRPASLHPLRIAGKKLRYRLELLAPGLTATDFEALYQLLERLQDRLGAINDHVVAIERMSTYAVANADPLLQKEHDGLQLGVEQFSPWFHDDFLPRFQSAIEAMEPPDTR